MFIKIEETVKRLQDRDKILIISHVGPDGDTIGSAFALYHALKSLGKTVRVECSDEFPKQFDYMYVGYELTEFEEEFVVCVDIASNSLLGDKFNDLKIDLNIDHHVSNQGFAHETQLEETAATCEIVYLIIEKLNVEITPLIADCLYTGIITDSGCFKYSSTSSQTHIIAAKLIEAGTRYEELNRKFFDIRTKQRIIVENDFVSKLEYYYNDRVAMGYITLAMLDSVDDKDELDALTSIPSTIQGVEVGIVIKEKDGGGHKVSVRISSGTASANDICAVFGGGGHAKAGGCFIDADYETSKAKLVEAIKGFM